MIMCFIYWSLLFPHPFHVSSPSLTLFSPFILNPPPCLLSLQHFSTFFFFCVYHICAYSSNLSIIFYSSSILSALIFTAVVSTPTLS
ncbi:hypothetical protein DER46DRAFT_42186 [Fusarium sp. MPI-SDFR-AT-0072]|nr:hypothetical protein DER46DRAFT_42186 [Fusarium sp. MPI-SDFR-AT-0072]